MFESNPHPKADPGVAVVLGSAFLGIYAHGGFLQGLNDAGIYPGHLSGASAGAMAAGFYAAGLRGKNLEDAVLSGKLKRAYPDLGMILRSAPMFFIGRLTGLMNGKKVIRHLETELPVANIEDTPGVKLSLVVTDLRKREGVFLSKGPLAQSMMASCSVPILFTAQTMNGNMFHDGGILHELPIDPFINDASVHTIIVHSLAGLKTTSPKHLKVSAPFGEGHKMLNHALFEFRKTEAERNGKTVVFVETEHPSPGVFQSPRKKKDYFEKGRATASTVNLPRVS